MKSPLPPDSDGNTQLTFKDVAICTAGGFTAGMVIGYICLGVNIFFGTDINIFHVVVGMAMLGHVIGWLVLAIDRLVP